LPQFLRPDSFYRKIYEKKTIKMLTDAAEAVFRKKYDEITQEDLHLFTENIIERLYLLKKYVPKHLGIVLKAVLRHPNINILDKNVIFPVILLTI